MALSEKTLKELLDQMRLEFDIFISNSEQLIKDAKKKEKKQ